MFTIQHLVHPSLEHPVSEDLYVRFSSSGGYADLRDGVIHLAKGSTCRFDTYFNSLSVSAWKTHSPLDDLNLVLRGSGRFILRLGLHCWGLAHRWLAESTVTLSADQDTIIPISDWNNIKGGLLYYSLHALEDGTVTAGSFQTSTEPVTDVRLGIVITHFNRREWVVPALRRLTDELLSDPHYGSRIELIVVDNSQNLSPTEAGAAQLIPNRNLGGSGGFMRGLLELEDSGRFTHCLFMDDDASCEIESIRRACALLSFARTPRFAVAGALLREAEGFRLFEKGARFDGLCRPLSGGLDMRHVGDLLQAERTLVKPNYGGWWFFAFRLSDVRHYAFPFFVRGDDIMFGMMNEFDICTQIGISCWGEDFSLKSGPVPLYLDVRNHILNQIALLGRSRVRIIRDLFKHFLLSQLYSYNYASADAVCLALKHVCEGEQFWRVNLDMANIRGTISAIPAPEKMLPTPDKLRSRFHYSPGHRSWYDKFLRKLSFNGHLLPKWMIRNRILYQEKGFYASPKNVFRTRSVYYGNEPLNLGYLASIDQRRFFRTLSAFARLAASFCWNFQSVKLEAGRSIANLTQRTFWTEVYRDAPDISIKSRASMQVSPGRNEATLTDRSLTHSGQN